MIKHTAIVVGVGAEQGHGAALCRRFAQSQGAEIRPHLRITCRSVFGDGGVPNVDWQIKKDSWSGTEGFVLISNDGNTSSNP